MQRKVLVGAVLVVLSLMLSLSSALASENVKVLVNGVELSSDVPPQIINGRTMVPIRAIAESLDLLVDWSDVAQAVYVGFSHEKLLNDIEKMIAADPSFSEDLSAILEEVSPQAEPKEKRPAPSEPGKRIRLFINGREVVPDVPPQIVDGRVLVPLRVIAEAFGAEVNWDGLGKVVSIIIDKKKDLKNRVKAALSFDSRLAEDFKAILNRYTKQETTQQQLKPSREVQQQQGPVTQYLQQLQQYLEQLRRLQQSIQEFQRLQELLRLMQQQQPPEWSQPNYVQQIPWTTISNETKEILQSEIEGIRRMAQNKREYINQIYNINKQRLDRQKEEAKRAALEKLAARGLGESGLVNYEMEKIEQQFAPLYQSLEAERAYNLSQIDNWERTMIEQLEMRLR